MDVHVTALYVGILYLFLGHRSYAVNLDHCYNCQLGAKETEVDVCQCDEQCTVYGDCCNSTMESLLDNDIAASHPRYECRSVFVKGSSPQGLGMEKAFWMVASCPPKWNGTVLQQDCTNGSNFYPATDMNTGLVYINTHCAACNSVIDTLVHWKYNLVCSETLLNLIKKMEFNFTVEALTKYCQPCSYVEPDPFNLTSPPGLPAPPPRPCYLNTASCISRDRLEAITLQPWTDEQYSKLVENCTNGPYSLVRAFLQPTLYRNQYCAFCNGIVANSLTCAGNENKLDSCKYTPNTPPTSSPSSPPTGTSAPPPSKPGSGESPFFPSPAEKPGIPNNEENGESFSLVLDIFGNGVVVVESTVITTFVTVICSKGQVFDPIFDDCRQTVCPDGFTMNDGTCKLSSSNATTNDTNCPNGLVALNDSMFEWVSNDTVLFNGTFYDTLLRDPVGRPVVCSGIPLCSSYIALTEDDEYEYTDNDTICYNDEEYHVMFHDTLGQPVICANFSINGIREVNVTVLTYSYPGGFVELTYIGCSFSILGCVLILLTYSLFKELRTLPSKILMNLAAAILVSNLFLLLSDLGGDSQDFCIATAIILHLFFLAQLSWMSIMTFEMGRIFNSIRKLIKKSKMMNDTKLLFVYTVIGWGIPAIIVGVSVAVNFITDKLVLYGETEDGEEGSCWINHLESVVVAFVAPVALLILFNAVVFTFVSVWLFKAWRTQTKLSTNQSVPFFRIYLAVVSITGLTWIFGFLAILAGTSWSWYPFIILNSFQGFTIFVLFLLTRKVLHRYLACLTCGRVREVPVSSTKGILMRITSKSSIKLQTTWYYPNQVANEPIIAPNQEQGDLTTNYDLLTHV